MSTRHYTPLFFLKKHIIRIRRKRAYLQTQFEKVQARLRAMGVFSRWLRPSIRNQLCAVRRVAQYLQRELERLTNLEYLWSGTAAARM